MATYEQLIEAVETAKSQLRTAENALHQYQDGFIYLVKIRCYGSISWRTYYNQYPLQEISDEYSSGDDGLIEIYTNNMKCKKPNSYGGLAEFKRMSTKKLLAMSKEEVSMSRAISNFMTGIRM